MGKVYVGAVNNLLKRTDGPVSRKVRKVADDTSNGARKIAEAELGKHPRDKARTGNYAKGFNVKQRRTNGMVGYVVKNPMSYAFILERGSRAHKIRARRARNLMFVDRNGNFRVEKVVNHPGTQPYRILERAAKIAVKKS